MKETVAVAVAIVLLAGSLCAAQVVSPRVLVKGQIDTTDLKAFAEGIYQAAGAVTPRQKAEAIWRFFLTDGRFVEPGLWYHIAGWAYEEPGGEVLDPIKLLNSYGFGLCYQIAPLLQATYHAGGFDHARVWFLTGHTVTEVFYDGAYHYFDSDMLGYSVVGEGDAGNLPVASVSQIARDATILTGKLKSPREVDPAKVDYPWYPADLREGAIGGLTELFTTITDNWLFSGTRYPREHSMDFALRPGERVTRYFKPEDPGLFYLPYAFNGETWAEFPVEVPKYSIRTEDGPHSQRDGRRWATGRIEYRPVLSDSAAYYRGRPSQNDNLRLADPRRGRAYVSRKAGNRPGTAIFEILSPWVLLDAALTVDASIQDQAGAVQADVSTDGGVSWLKMGRLAGPHTGSWEPKIPVLQRSEHGVLTPIAGKYGFLVRLQLLGAGGPDSVILRNLEIVGRFQHNPRTLPALLAGDNDLQYRTGDSCRHNLPVPLDQLDRLSIRKEGIRRVSEAGQDILWPEGETGELVLCVSAPDNGALTGFDAGARFLDLRDGLAPDKLTAETRTTRVRVATPDSPRYASMKWSTSLTGPFTTLWEYSPAAMWPDGFTENQLLRWPEVDRTVNSVPPGTKKVYVRYALKNMGMDSVRLAARVPAGPYKGTVEITHVWRSDGQKREHKQRLTNTSNYQVNTGTSADIVNEALIVYCSPGRTNY
ncbi:MAG: hypothetical protein EHM61_16000 [Acidobacteria bacterium]|nr:MAG: hypothetical protein EHM61_16000 [Acidobacteriota bacterium]